MIEILPIDFLGQGALLQPADQALHDKAVEYCRRQLTDGDSLNLAKFSKVWVAVEDGEVTGITGYVIRPDVPVFRATGKRGATVTKRLMDRLRSHFQDQGWRGYACFVHISSRELPEQRCPKWQESLTAVKAEPADRFSVEI